MLAAVILIAALIAATWRVKEVFEWLLEDEEVSTSSTNRRET